MTVATMPAPARPRTLEGDHLNALRARLRGRLITPDDLDYDQVRRVVNFTVDRRPLAIVRAADVHDVAAAVVFAREYELLLFSPERRP